MIEKTGYGCVVDENRATKMFATFVWCTPNRYVISCEELSALCEALRVFDWVEISINVNNYCYDDIPFAYRRLFSSDRINIRYHY